jgi:predicted O-methyltransferase YrrM
MAALPEELNERIRAFQESRVILTALELDLFTAIGDGAGGAEVAARLGAAPRATEMLLNALAAMRLLDKREGVFYNSAEAARYFAAGSPDNARPALLHTAHLWQTWSTLTTSVRPGTETAEDWTEAFIAAMHRNASERAPLVVRAVGAEKVRRMLDVGGGSGAYSIAFAGANPALLADILDKATVEPIARRHIEAAGVGERVQVRAGDLRCGRLGEGYDLVFLSAICHMLDEAENLDLLRRCREALIAGGRIVIQDFILEPDKTAPRHAALFALNMLVGTPGGSAYSEPEYARWLGEAGFEKIERVRLPGPTGLMIGWRL